MSRDHLRRDAPPTQQRLEPGERLNGQLVVLRESVNEAVPSVRTKPDSVAGEEVGVVHQIDHVAPGVARHEDSLYLDAIDPEDIAVVEQNPLVVDRDLRQPIEAKYHLAFRLAREVAVLDATDIERCCIQQVVPVALEGSYVVGVLVGDEHVGDAGRIYVKPGHLLAQTLIAVPGIDHNGGAVLGVEEDVGNPLAHAGNTLINPAGVQRLEDLLSAISQRHDLLLELRCLS